MADSTSCMISQSYNEMNISFRILPPQVALLLADSLAELAALPGCLDYLASVSSSDKSHWTIRGVWINDESRIVHYHSTALQRLICFALRNNASHIIFSESI